jgi:hypothetical protein
VKANRVHSRPRVAPQVLAFVEELAVLYAALWVDGKLDQIREEVIDAATEDE